MFSQSSKTNLLFQKISAAWARQGFKYQYKGMMAIIFLLDRLAPEPVINQQSFWTLKNEGRGPTWNLPGWINQFSSLTWIFTWYLPPFWDDSPKIWPFQVIQIAWITPRDSHANRFTPWDNNNNWLVVSTPLNNMSQWEGLSHILWKIKHVWNHQPYIYIYYTIYIYQYIPTNSYKCIQKNSIKQWDNHLQWLCLDPSWNWSASPSSLFSRTCGVGKPKAPDVGWWNWTRNGMILDWTPNQNGH